MTTVVQHEIRLVGKTRDEVRRMLDAIAREPTRGWSRDVDAERRYEQERGTKLFFFSRRMGPGGTVADTTATLWFAPRGTDEWRLAGLITDRPCGFTLDAYNGILEDFYEAALRPIHDGFQVDVRLGPVER
jgi:hypothetical protein